MPIDLIQELRLVDNHCHGLRPIDLSRADFELHISESFVPAPKGTSHFDAPVGLALRAFCPPLLDLEPFCDPDDYMARRNALGAAEVNRRFLKAGNYGELLIDTGFRSSAIMTPEEMQALSGIPAYEVVRIEAVAERVAREGTSAAGYAKAYAEALAEASRDAVGLKSILGYRGGFEIDPRPPSAAEVEAAAGRWLKEGEAAGKYWMADPVLLRFGLWTAAELGRQRGFPIQFHVGFGDRDLTLHQNNPSLLTDFFMEMDKLGVDCVLLHCYPFHREAGYLCEVFPNLYFDVGVILNYTGPQSGHILGEALELAPFTKQLYSSDAFGVAEFYYMQSQLFRRHLGRTLDAWIADGLCNLKEAERIARLIAVENVERAYPALARVRKG